MHPYYKYERTELWKIVKQAIDDLQENQDLELLTKEDYVIGYICKSIFDSSNDISFDESKV